MRAKQIERLIVGGAFRADEAKVRRGMEEWKSVEDSGLLEEAQTQPDMPEQEAVEEKEEQSPYQAPRAAVVPVEAQLAEASYGGIGRLAYFFAPFGVWALMFLGLVLMFGLEGALGLFSDKAAETAVSGYVIALLAGVVILSIWIQVARLNNLGMSGWWVLGLIVPIMNIWLNWRLLACPEGYAVHRQLDLPGKILTFVFIILPLGLVALGLLTGLAKELAG